MTFSTPLDFAASSAADLTSLPAMKAVTEPPNFVPAVMAANDCDTIFPSFCSRMANVDANRAKAEAEYWGTAMGCDCHSRVRAVRRAEWRATENMVGEVRRQSSKPSTSKSEIREKMGRAAISESQSTTRRTMTSV